MLTRQIWTALAAVMTIFAVTAHAETGVTDTAILIGQSAAFSGPAQELGLEMRQGAKLVFDSVNAQGGIHGRKIQLIAHDDGYEPERAAANTRKLINEDRVFALFGYVGTPTSQAALPIFTEAKVPFIGAFTGAQLLREPFNRHIFNVRASYFDETEKIIEQLVSLGAKTIAVFYQNDAYGKAGLAGVERALAKRSMKMAATATVERNTVDVAAAVKTIHPTRPDAVVMVSAYKSVAAFVKEMKKAGSATQFHNVSFVGSRPLAKELGPDGTGVAISQVVPFPWSGSVPVVRDYQKLMNESGAKEFSFTSLEGFIAARILMEGLKRAGKDLTREKLISALEGMNNVDLGGFQVAFSPKNHNASHYVDLTMIGKTGQFVR
jgi:ABC-type branched-subunit amino acid transport system substrate-binding protein